ncbi:D-alanyl-D-alanine carboxypeptidase precursor [Planctomycetes bacterium Poly30]|uniref:D-alanyl-D-alanine carboxypeptidase n=1 Tax=Saltatorellus ferox TaxID=2528018 RepID=A0A518F104_9BACT|nr:D-alanyl-D-alanine carboxypeptidase precursor [Planctomycetes bacterium Poly30]
MTTAHATTHLRRRLATVGVCLAIASISARSAASARGSGATAIAEDPKRAIAEYMAGCEALGWSGVVLVRHQGKVLYHEAHGLADRETGRALEKDTRFEIASLTKPLTATAIMGLVDEGKVDLDASIADYLPGVPDHAKAITVSHLLSHESGMPRSAGGGRGDDLAIAVADYLREPPVHAPGTREDYWNGGYALLAGIVETVDGNSFEESVRKRVFRPAKMKSSGFIGEDVPEKEVARGYEAGKESRLATEPPYGGTGWHYRGMGGIVTHAEDLLRFVDAFDSGRIVKQGTAKLMQTRASANHGLGWGIAYSMETGLRRVHGGDVRGFHVYLTSLVDKKVDVIVLSNFGPTETYKVTWNLEALALGQELPHAAPPERAVWKAKDLEALRGTWTSAQGSVLEVEPGSAGLLVTRTEEGGLDADPHVARMKEFISFLQAGNLEGVRSSVTTEWPDWPERLIKTVWPAHVAKHGELLEFLPFAVHEQDNGFVSVRFELKHATGSLFGYSTLKEGRVAMLVLDQAEYVTATSKGYTSEGPVRSPPTWWMPVSDTELVSYDWRKGQEAARMRLDDRPRKATTISLEEETFERARAEK